MMRVQKPLISSTPHSLSSVSETLPLFIFLFCLTRVPHYIQAGRQRTVVMGDFLSASRSHVKVPGCLHHLS